MRSTRTSSRHHTARRVVSAAVVMGSLAAAAPAGAQSAPTTPALTVGPLPGAAAKMLCVTVDAQRKCVKTPVIAGTTLTVRHTLTGGSGLAAPTAKTCTGGVSLSWKSGASKYAITADVRGTTPLGTPVFAARTIDVPLGARAVAVEVCDG